MKKSYAILAIAECLIEPHYPDDPMKESEYILKKLLRFGMSPGLIKNPNFQGGHNIDIEPVYIHEWEDEDEEV